MREDFTFLSNDGKTKLHGVKWTPDHIKDEEAEGVLQLTHGMIEYIMRYDGFARFMTEQGWIVVGHDHLGHGESASSKDDLGYFCERHPDEVLVEDMHSLRKLTQEQYPELPYFMLGHSMGSYLLRKYISVHGEGLNGAVIVGTGYIAPMTGKSGLLVVKLLSKIRGSRYRSPFVENLTFGKEYKQFDMTGEHPENSWLTKDTAIVRKYYSDPFCTYKFTLNGYRGLIETTNYTCRQENIDKIPKKLPLFIISGDHDPVGSLGKGVTAVYQMMQSSGIQDVTMKLYENDRHEILNETDKETVYQDILNWLKARK